MIVQCDQCNTRFKLDDAKVKEEGVKVRCSKCKHIFVVKKETPHEETEFESILGQLGTSPSDEVAARTEQPPGLFGGTKMSHADVSQAADSKSPEPPSVEREESQPEESFGDFPVGAGAEPAAPEMQDFDFEQFSSAEEPAATKSASSALTGTADGKDDEFVFGEIPTPLSDKEYEVKVEGAEKTDWSSDFDSQAAPAGEAFREGIPADEDFSFIFTKDDEGSASSQADEEPMSPAHDEAGFLAPEKTGVQKEESGDEGSEFIDSSPTDFGAVPLDGNTPPVSKHETSEERGSDQTWHTDEFFALSPSTGEPVREDDLPPLSIASRRKVVTSAPIIVIAIAVVLVLTLAGAGFYFLTEGPAGFDKDGFGFMSKWLGLDTKEDGGISIRNAKGSFVVNKELGELFIIRGEAVNNFRKPRASIQVKAVLYGPKGQVAVQKSAYCGNMLSDEQVATLPLAKLDETMNNQFGDSLSNLGVQPGKGIPFVVILGSVPKDVTEFGVEVIGSTVASR